MKILAGICGALTIFFLALPTTVKADNPQFAVTQEILYSVHENGLTTITQNLTLTNLSSDYFPQEYVLKLGNFPITNLQATDLLGRLPTNDVSQNGSYEVHIKFNDQVIGEGKILRFTVTYDSSAIASHQGRLWNILIPSNPKLAGLTNLAIRLATPSSFGQKIFAKPEPKTPDLFWDLTAAKSPINIVFGPDVKNPSQTLAFNLKYHLYNSRLYPVSGQIALPADSDYQKIFLSGVSPKPSDVIQDTAGNWLAQYPLGPAEKLDVQVTGEAIIFLQSQMLDSTTRSNNQYLQPTKDWPSQDNQIKKIASSLQSPADIYNYVINFLNYTNSQSADQARVGGLGTFLTPTKAGPQEFSDLFITLCRARGFPAREVDGFVLGKSTQRHIWPEYFDTDRKTWVMVDPALAKISSSLDYFQTFDLSHLSLFRASDSLPPLFPTSNTIQTTNDTPDLTQIPKALISANLPKEITAGFVSSGQVYLENPGPTLFPTNSVALKTSLLKVSPPIILTDNIPPFGHQELTLKMVSDSWTSDYSDIIGLKFGVDSQTYPIKVIPLYKNGYLLIFGGLIILGIISLVTQITRGLFLQKQPRSNNLRRQG